MTYRDLTGDDVLQAGDECKYDDYWADVHESNFGKSVSIFPGCTCRRPLTPAEITAAERVKFEAWIVSEFAWRVFRRNAKGGYKDEKLEDYWRCWCAAVGCDPMGDT